MTPREETARAIAYYETSEDMAALRAALEEAAPRVKRMVGTFLKQGTEETIPGPADLRGAKDAATATQALQTLRKMQDFALLQSITRAVGRRIETLEIAASAEFPEGVRVMVPEGRSYPRGARELPGKVEETGTVLRVLLDSGETWEGPASLARLGSIR
ncbi:MAG: hypothetical protein ABI577_05570 [bacterium]